MVVVSIKLVWQRYPLAVACRAVLGDINLVLASARLKAAHSVNLEHFRQGLGSSEKAPVLFALEELIKLVSASLLSGIVFSVLGAHINRDQGQRRKVIAQNVLQDPISQTQE